VPTPEEPHRIKEEMLRGLVDDLERFEASMREVQECLPERSSNLVSELLALAGKASRAERVWRAIALLGSGWEATELNQAGELAPLAKVATQATDSESKLPGHFAVLLAPVLSLVGDVSRRFGQFEEAEEAFVFAGSRLASESDLDERASWCVLLSRLRRDQGRADEAVGLLLRAKALYDSSGDVSSGEAALKEAREVERESEKGR